MEKYCNKYFNIAINTSMDKINICLKFFLSSSEANSMSLCSKFKKKSDFCLLGKKCGFSSKLHTFWILSHCAVLRADNIQMHLLSSRAKSTLFRLQTPTDQTLSSRTQCDKKLKKVLKKLPVLI